MSPLDPLAQLLNRRPKRLALLEQIAEQGSITRAAKAAGLSYKAAWDAIDELNNLSEQPLVSRSVGGKGGGGARLTPAGERLLALPELRDDVAFCLRRDALDFTARLNAAGQVVRVA